MTKTAGASAKSGTTEVSKPSTVTLNIERHKTFTVFNDGSKEHRVSVCTINNKIQIGLSKFWLLEKEKKWLPSKKGHFYMSADQWRKFAQLVPAITQSLNKLEKSNSTHVLSSSGTLTILFEVA